jgi:glycopeptide antibiotics resistance protein
MKKKAYPKSTPFWRFLFVVYCALLLWLLFDRTPGWGNADTYAEVLRDNMNLIPLHTIGNYWKVVSRWEFTPVFRHCVINLGGNIFLFIPIGYFLPRFWPFLRNFFSFLLTCTMAITLVELLQLVTLRGSLDIDDLILNLGGMLVGYLTCIIVHKRGKK